MKFVLKSIPLLILLGFLFYVISDLHSEREANKKYLNWKLSYYKRDVDLTPDDKTCTQFLICTTLSAERPLDKSCSTILFKYVVCILPLDMAAFSLAISCNV